MLSKNKIVKEIIGCDHIECEEILNFLSFQPDRLDYCACVYISKILEKFLIKYKNNPDSLLYIEKPYMYVQQYLNENVPPYKLQAGYCLKCHSPSRINCLLLL